MDSSAWKATDIVVATEYGLADGKLSVLEAWKGSLVAKDALVVPELRRFADAENRIVKSDHLVPKKEGTPPVVVSGKRMILFLKRASSQPANQETVRIHWEPVNGFGGFEVSVVWIKEESAYTFVQEMNPGPSQLTSIDYSETKMKKRVVEVVRLQESLATIAAIPATEERADKAAPYVRAQNYFACKEAYRILAGCGASAVPVLRKMLQNEPTGGSATIDALAAAGGSAVAPEFVQILDSESAFWRARAPTLEKGWWNGAGLRWSEVEPLRDRYCMVLSVLGGLGQMKFEGSRKSVQAFRDYWRSLPQLDDKSGLTQMSQACDEVLKALDQGRSPSERKRGAE